MAYDRRNPRRPPLEDELEPEVSPDPPPLEDVTPAESHVSAPDITPIMHAFFEEKPLMATPTQDLMNTPEATAMNGAFDPKTVSLPHELIEPEPAKTENVFIQRSDAEQRIQEISDAGNKVLRLISEAMSIQLSAAEMKNKMLQSTLLARQQGNEPASQSQLLAWLFQSDGQEQVSAAAHQGTKIIIGLANEIAKAAHVDLDRVPFTVDGAEKSNSAIVQLRDILLARLNDGRGTPTPASRSGTSYSA